MSTDPQAVNRHLSVESWSGKQIELTAEVFSSGWNAALGRHAKVVVQDTTLDSPPPKVVSFKARARPPKIQSYFFSESREAWRAEDLTAKSSQHASVAAEDPSVVIEIDWRKATRLQPPKDVVKVRDRLYYMLQPPLETLVGAQQIRFPFHPFRYQFKGVAFLFPRHAAVLADEMGLGKTMQAITSIRLLLLAGQIRSVLLICPKPLVSNWRREFEQWAPEIPLCIIEGNRQRRQWCWREASSPVKIANYELLVRDSQWLEPGDCGSDLVVLDEAQRIKNRNSTTAQAVKSLPRTRSWALTGTPVENSPRDLVGVFEFVAPGVLHEDMPAVEIGRAAGEYILRRTKDMVMTDMPPKMFRDATLSLSRPQQDSYFMAEDAGVMKLSEMGQELTIQHVFELVLRLKQICNFDPVSGASSKAERLEADIEEVAASGKKAIVFSQWVRTLTRLRERLARFQPLEYHGRIPARQRDGVIERFRERPEHHVILMSYGAGGVGLNLQFCEYVFLFDRWWNPAVEDQAINRAHRIGAAGPVTITRMLTLGTIEERIDQVLRDKRALFEAVLGASPQPKNLGLSQDEIFGLFHIQSTRRKAG